MLIIRKGQSNTIVVTLNEKNTLSNPNYLFEFENKVTKAKAYCVPTDISQYKDRYNEFAITETANPANLNQITLATTGEWVYRIYEQASSTNINPSLAGAIVETGLCTVNGANSTQTVYSVSTSRTVYNGNN